MIASRLVLRSLLVAGFAGAAALPTAAHAYWAGGIWIAPPVYAPPPPPVYVQPPVTYVPPPPGAAYAYGITCFAGFYTCQLPAAGPLGAECSCPGLGAPSYGTIH